MIELGRLRVYPPRALQVKYLSGGRADLRVVEECRKAYKERWADVRPMMAKRPQVIPDSSEKGA